MACLQWTMPQLQVCASLHNALLRAWQVFIEINQDHSKPTIASVAGFNWETNSLLGEKAFVFGKHWSYSSVTGCDEQPLRDLCSLTSSASCWHLVATVTLQRTVLNSMTNLKRCFLVRNTVRKDATNNLIRIIGKKFMSVQKHQN